MPADHYFFEQKSVLDLLCLNSLIMDKSINTKGNIQVHQKSVNNWAGDLLLAVRTDSGMRTSVECRSYLQYLVIYDSPAADTYRVHDEYY